MEKKLTGADIKFTAEELVPYIERVGKDLEKKVSAAKAELGDRYDHKNRIEEMYRKFGDPARVPEKFAEEFILIVKKKSTLPAAVRNPVTDVCNAALNQLFFDKLKEMAEEKKKEEKAEG